MIQSIRSTSWTGYMLMKVLGLREPNTFGNIVYVCVIYIYYIYNNQTKNYSDTR